MLWALTYEQRCGETPPYFTACRHFHSSQYRSGEWTKGPALESDSLSHTPTALEGQL